MNAISAIISFIFLAIMLFIIIIVTGMILTGKALVNAIGSVIPGAVIKDTVDDIISGEIFQGKTDVGGSCKLDTDCKGWGPATDAIACCKGKCTKKLKDWAGVGYCPDVCTDAPAPLGKPGSCESGNTWPRSKDQPCDTHVACKDWVAGKVGALACCNGKCTPLLKDWAGVGYCPAECTDAPAPLGKPGSCESGNTWKRSEGQPCDTHLACDGWVAGKVGTLACCKGKCTKQIKNWAGVGFCPADCDDAPAPLGKPGTCDSGNTWPRSEGQPCDTHVACKGWVAGKVGSLACCNGKCTPLVKDWAGVGYCPDECRGGALEKPGTCGKDCKKYLEKCSKSTQCCSGKCSLLNGVAKKVACPCGYVDHGSYACCKFCAGGKEDKNNCPKFSCGT